MNPKSWNRHRKTHSKLVRAQLCCHLQLLPRLLSALARRHSHDRARPEGVLQQLPHAILRSARMTCESPPIKHQNRGLRLEDFSLQSFARQTSAGPTQETRFWARHTASLAATPVRNSSATCKRVVQPSNKVVVVVTVFCLKAQIFACFKSSKAT